MLRLRVRDINIVLLSLCFWAVLIFMTHSNTLHMSISDWIIMYTLSGLVLLVERFKFTVRDDIVIYLETVYLVAFTLAFSFQPVIWAGIVYAAVSSFNNKYWYVQFFNASLFVFCAVSSRYLADLLFPHAPVGRIDAYYLIVYTAVCLAINVAGTPAGLLVWRGWDAVKKGLKELVTLQVLAALTVNIAIGIALSLIIRQAGLGGAILFTGLILIVAHFYRDYFKMANHFRELSIRDEVTGIHNHRYIHSHMDKLIEAETPFALLMLDIDHFKRYNEHFGHVQGDHALNLIGNALESTRADGEEVARYSGEEFAVVLPLVEQLEVMQRAEDFRTAIENTVFPGTDSESEKHLTASVGIALYPEMATNKKELLMMVDDALYRGKFGGRNKVSIYTSIFDEMQDDGVELEGDQEIIKTIKVFLMILNSQDRYTYAHTERVVRYSTALAKKVGIEGDQLRDLRFAAFLHDIGKVQIPVEILTKRSFLTQEEWEIMKSHVELGVEIAQPVKGLEACLPIIRHHHERFGGGGYPDGIAGEEIPYLARIVTVVDSFDAMTTSRPYQRKRTMDEAFQELRTCAGRQFDPTLVEPFIEVVQEIGLLLDEEEELELA